MSDRSGPDIETLWSLCQASYELLESKRWRLTVGLKMGISRAVVSNVALQSICPYPETVLSSRPRKSLQQFKTASLFVYPGLTRMLFDSRSGVHRHSWSQMSEKKNITEYLGSNGEISIQSISVMNIFLVHEKASEIAICKPVSSVAEYIYLPGNKLLRCLRSGPPATLYNVKKISEMFIWKDFWTVDIWKW